MNRRPANAHVMAEGYFSQAWRVLGEGLGPYVYDHTGDRALRGKRDVHAILQKMLVSDNWDQFFKALGRREQSWASELFDARNKSWAHQGVYGDDDIHHLVGVMGRLLRSIHANEQEESIWALHTAIGRLIYGQNVDSGEDTKSHLLLSLLETIRGDDLTERLERLIPAVSSQGHSSSLTTSDSPTNSSHASLLPRDEYVRLGESSLAQGDYDEAIAFFHTAIEYAPEDPSTYRARGYIYIQKGDHDLALTDYTKAIDLDPKDPRTYRS